MSNHSGKLLSSLLITSFAGSLLAIAAHSPARADDTCLSGPKATTPRGGHWYYRVEPGTKRHCWYLGAARGKTAQKTAAKLSPPASPAPPNKPAETSAETPLQPSVADAHAEFDGATGARDQANASPPPPDTDSSNARDQASAAPASSDTTPSDEVAQTADTDTPPPAATTSWPDPAINTTQAINAVQPPAPVAAVAPSPQLQDDRPASSAAVAPTPQLLGERSDPGPAVSVVDAPESETSSYSLPVLLGWFAGALAFAGLLGFAVVKFGNLSSFMHIRRRQETIWDVVDAGHPPPWQRQEQRKDIDIAPKSDSDLLRTRQEIEAQSRDIMEILARASRGATT
jgi:hypothetical protein